MEIQLDEGSNPKQRRNNSFNVWKYVKNLSNVTPTIIASALCTGLGNSIESVSILSWLQPFFLLVSIHFASKAAMENNNSNSSSSCDRCCTCTSQRSITTYAQIVILNGFGSCLGFSCVFGFPKTTFATIIVTLFMGFICWLLISVFAIMPHHYFYKNFPHSPLLSFIYPAASTFVYHTLIGKTMSTFMSPANSVLDFLPLRQLATLLGASSINFVLCLVGTICAILYTNEHNETVKRTAFRCFWILMFLFVTTGFIMVSDEFYQKDVSTTILPYIDVSCLLSQNAKIGSVSWNYLRNNTEQRLAAGDEIVLWSEEAINVYSYSEESQLLNEMSLLASKYNDGFVGITYMLVNPDNRGYDTNHFVLITPTGGIAWNYKKAHPVPLVESSVKAGVEILPTYDSPFGRLGGAICFDFDYPSFIQQAGDRDVDMMLQPSWTWRAINSRHFEGDTLRGIENGFTHVRCSSDGESGVVDRRGKMLQRRETAHDYTQVYQFQVPIQPRVKTMYSAIGFIFEYLCIVLTAFALFVTLVLETLRCKGYYDLDQLTCIKNNPYLQSFLSWSLGETWKSRFSHRPVQGEDNSEDSK